MRILANENIPLLAIEALRTAGHDVLWARADMPGAGDPAVLARAAAEGRMLVTFDKDFGELVYRAGQAGGVGIVLFRIPQEIGNSRRSCGSGHPRKPHGLARPFLRRRA